MLRGRQFLNPLQTPEHFAARLARSSFAGIGVQQLIERDIERQGEADVTRVCTMPILAASSTWVKPRSLRMRATRCPMDSLPQLRGGKLSLETRGMTTPV